MLIDNTSNFLEIRSALGQFFRWARTPAAGLPGVLLAAALCAGFWACRPSGPGDAASFLIRVGDQRVSVVEFERAFKLVKIEYPLRVARDPDLVAKVRKRFLGQMIDELLVMQRAAELRIGITEEELDRAVAEFKVDYPENAFETMLTEYAVSFDSWRERLRVHLLIEKVVAQDLRDAVNVTPKDLSDYLARRKEPGRPEGDNTRVEPFASGETEKVFLNRIRKEKAEENYTAWIESLRQRYPVQVDAAQWEKLSKKRRP